MKDRIYAYEAQGVPHSKIAEMIGCSSSYVSQVLQEEGAADEVLEYSKKLKRNKAESELEEGYMKLEVQTMSAIGENVAFAEMGELTRLMAALSQRRATKALNPQNSLVSNVTNNTVILNIPSAVVPEIVVNAQKEVVAIGDRSLAPMAAAGVRELFSKIQERRELPAKVKQEIEDAQVLTTIPDDF